MTEISNERPSRWYAIPLGIAAFLAICVLFTLIAIMTWLGVPADPKPLIDPPPEPRGDFFA